MYCNLYNQAIMLFVCMCFWLIGTKFAIDLLQTRALHIRKIKMRFGCALDALWMRFGCASDALWMRFGCAWPCCLFPKHTMTVLLTCSQVFRWLAVSMSCFSHAMCSISAVAASLYCKSTHDTPYI